MISKFTIYTGIAIGIIFQGETALIGAGHLIYVGTIKFWHVVLIATILSTLNGELFFMASKTGINLLPETSKNLRVKFNKVFNLIKRYKTLLILFSRFMYGVRNLIPVAFGLSGIKHFEFAILNFAGALIWAFTFTSLGLASGKATSIFLDLERYQLLIFGFFIGIAFTITMFRILNTIKQKGG